MARTLVGRLCLLVIVAVSVLGVTTARAQQAGGSISGRVLWGSCAGVPLPLGPDGMPAAQSGAPADVNPAEAPTGASPDPAQRIVPPGRVLPAGAVLVAVQNSAISARTDEAGRFTLAGAPAGQYLTVAAGPVANSASAIAQRPNVLVQTGQSVDIGTLVLGGASPGGFPCRAIAPMAAPGVSTGDSGDPTP